MTKSHRGRDRGDHADYKGRRALSRPGGEDPSPPGGELRGSCHASMKCVVVRGPCRPESERQRFESERGGVDPARCTGCCKGWDRFASRARSEARMLADRARPLPRGVARSPRARDQEKPWKSYKIAPVPSAVTFCHSARRWSEGGATSPWGCAGVQLTADRRALGPPSEPPAPFPWR